MPELVMIGEGTGSFGGVSRGGNMFRNSVGHYVGRLRSSISGPVYELPHVVAACCTSVFLFYLAACPSESLMISVAQGWVKASNRALLLADALTNNMESGRSMVE